MHDGNLKYVETLGLGGKTVLAWLCRAFFMHEDGTYDCTFKCDQVIARLCRAFFMHLKEEQRDEKQHISNFSDCPVMSGFFHALQERMAQ